MKRILKNILKWLICVLLTFSVVFTISQYLQIAEGVYLMINGDEVLQEVFEDESILEGAKIQEELVNKSFNNEEQDKNIRRVYSKYPVGTTMIFMNLVKMTSYGHIALTSIVLGVIIGTAIFMLLDKDKKGLTIAIALYILSIVILGFAQGFINISGEGLTLLERWMFPDEYIIPVTVVFVLVIVVRLIKQKDIANKLNEKLKERKEEKSK